MNLESLREPLNAFDSNLSGSSFRDVNLSDSQISNAKLQRLQLNDVDLSASRISNANLSQLQVEDCNLEGMLVDGVLITDLLAVYHAARAQG